MCALLKVRMPNLRRQQETGYVHHDSSSGLHKAVAQSRPCSDLQGCHLASMIHGGELYEVRSKAERWLHAERLRQSRMSDPEHSRLSQP